MLEDDRIRIAACVAGAVIVVVLALRALDRGDAPAAEPVRVSGAPGQRVGGRQSGGSITVHVAGAVRRPGVYRVPAGSRADAAVQVAGGVSRRGNGAGVNLAAPLQDGQQIVVPPRGAAAPAIGAAGAAPGVPSAAAGGAAAGGAKISLSSATAEQLDTLDGIGPTLAQRIVAYRDSRGGFRSVEELRQVEGIGEKRFEALKAAVAP